MARTEEKGTARTAATKRQRAAPAAGEGEPAGALPRRRAPRRDQASAERMGRNATAPAANSERNQRLAGLSERPAASAEASSSKRPKKDGSASVPPCAVKTACAAPPVPMVLGGVAVAAGAATYGIQTRPGAAQARAATAAANRRSTVPAPATRRCEDCSEPWRIDAYLCSNCYSHRRRCRDCSARRQSLTRSRATRTAIDMCEDCWNPAELRAPLCDRCYRSHRRCRTCRNRRIRDD